MMSISECLRFDSYKRMANQWPSVCQRVRALEEALALPEPPLVDRYERQPRRGVVSGISLEDFDTFEHLRELNAEYPWVKKRLEAIRAALGIPAQARATDSRPSAIAINW